MKIIKNFNEFTKPKFKAFESKKSELSEWQRRYDDLLMGMEEEAEPEGGEIADQYSKEMEEMEKEREEILNKYSPKPEPISKMDYLTKHLNAKQSSNLIDSVESGKGEEFIRIRLNFYGLSEEVSDEIIDFLFD